MQKFPSELNTFLPNDLGGIPHHGCEVLYSTDLLATSRHREYYLTYSMPHCATRANLLSSECPEPSIRANNIGGDSQPPLLLSNHHPKLYSTTPHYMRINIILKKRIVNVLVENRSKMWRTKKTINNNNNNNQPLY